MTPQSGIKINAKEMNLFDQTLRKTNTKSKLNCSQCFKFKSQAGFKILKIIIQKDLSEGDLDSSFHFHD